MSTHNNIEPSWLPQAPATLYKMGFSACELFATSFTEKSELIKLTINNKKEIDNQLQKIEKLAKKAKMFNLKVNAGHDLDTNNLVPLVELGLIDEVSIGPVSYTHLTLPTICSV